MASRKESEKRSKKVGLPLAPVGLVLSTVDSIIAKGGRSPLDPIKTTVGKSEGMVKMALSAASELGLVRLEGNDYALTSFGNEFATSSESERKLLLRNRLVEYEPYNTILLRLRNAPNRTLAKSDVTKAWYDLYRTGTDRTRQLYTGSFASICGWSGIVENRRKTVVMSSDGIALLEGTIPPEEPTTRIETQGTAIQLASKSQGATETKAVIPINATVSINISLDTKEEDSVRNLIRIIRALRGESEDSSPTNTSE